MLTPDMQTHLHDSFENIPADQWDRLSQAGASAQPFLQHGFLAALERCACATPTTGWAPQILGLYSDNTLQAAMPLYAKQHSMGEFVFDWSWADAYARNGLPYYPKLIAAVPFSPIQGSRLLAHDAGSRAILLDAALQHARAQRFSSLHILFPEPDELALYEAQGMQIRHGVQFHWRNADYRDFDDFLAALSRDKRKKIKQEQRRVREAGVTFQHLTGAAIQPEHLELAYACYANTYHVRGRHPYLTPAFFRYLGEHMADRLLLVIALREEGGRQRPVAMALNLRNNDTLWGRYWGCLENVPCLHFDTCYYQAIEFCIEHGIKLFEGGAQGEHKLARGFEPVTTYSAHWIADPEFRAAISHFLQRESRGIAEYLDELDEHSPFKT